MPHRTDVRRADAPPGLLASRVLEMDVSRGACVSVKLNNRDVAASGHRVSPAVVAPIDRSSQGDPTGRRALERIQSHRLLPQLFAAVRPSRERWEEYGGGFGRGDIFLAVAESDPISDVGGTIAKPISSQKPLWVEAAPNFSPAQSTSANAHLFCQCTTDESDLRVNRRSCRPAAFR